MDQERHLADPAREFRLDEDDRRPTTRTSMPKKVDGVWYKRGAGWGDGKDEPLTRFSLYADMTVESGREEVTNPQAVYLRRLQQERQCTARAIGYRRRSISTPRAAMPVGKAAWRRGRILTMMTIRRRIPPTRRLCSCRCSRRTRPALSGAISTATAPTMSAACPTATDNNWWADWPTSQPTRRPSSGSRTCESISWSSLMVRPLPRRATVRTRPARPIRSRR